MKIALFTIMSFTAFISAYTQPPVNVAGHELYISPGVIFHVNGLSLTPSSGFTLTNTSISRLSSAVHPGMGTTVARVFDFSQATGPYSGAIRFYYDDSELNGLPEGNLLMSVYTSAWITLSGPVRDGSVNYVENTAASNITMTELVLSDPVIVSLIWGEVEARRVTGGAVVEWVTMQERSVSHFVVERNTGNGWLAVSSQIEARNTSRAQTYHFEDQGAVSAAMQYRIRQVGIDGKQAVSTIVRVAADNKAVLIQVFPNPTTEGFSVAQANPSDILQVQLFDRAGRLVKNWTVNTNRYSVSDVNPGLYYVHVSLRDGRKQVTPVKIVR